MRFLFANAIFISFACLTGLLLIVVSVLGGDLREAATLILFPYISDTHLQTVRASEGLLRAAPAIAQLGMLGLILVLRQLQGKYARVSVSASGVILVIGYFIFLVSVQLIDSVH